MLYELFSSRRCNVCVLLQSAEEDIDGENENNKPGTQTEATKRAQKSLPKLYRCNGCQMVFYCNDEHRKLDWPMHRSFCQAAQKVMSAYDVEHPYLFKGIPKSRSDFEKKILQIKYLIRITLDRPLKYHEEELTSFPAHCAVCFKFFHVRPCFRCYAVSYCGDLHERLDAPEHNRVCGLLELYYCPYKLQKPRPYFIKLRKCVLDLQKMDLVEAFQRATLMRLPAQPTATLKDYQLFDTAADFSCVGTICYALSFLEMRHYKNQKFIIFVVGATVEQDLWFRDIHTQFFFLQFPDILYLELYFIGPDAELGERLRKVRYYFQEKHRSVLYITYRGYFHNFSLAFNVKPSLIIGYNCGFSEYKPLIGAKKEMIVNRHQKQIGSESILEICQTHNLPIVFTSLTSFEADMDYGALLRLVQTDVVGIHVERIFNVMKNPYRDLRPLRNWQHNDKEEIYFRNGYIQAVRTKLSS